MPIARSHLAFATGCAVLAIVVVVAWVGVQSFGHERRIVSATIAGNVLHVDSDYLPPAESRSDGERNEVNIVTRFPDFLPAHARVPSRVDGAGEIVVTLFAPDEAIDPVERPAKLYARFLEADVWSHPGGLMMRRFEAGSPYENEELYMAPPEGRAFFARCMRPPQTPDGLPDKCLSELRQAGLQARIRFSPELLPEWQAMMNGVRGLIRSLMRAG
jgi:hypothetical protein